MKTILLVRHGEADHLVSDLTGGWSQTSLTKNGELQARLIAARLGRELSGIDHAFYCSDLKRAKQTADIIAKVTGVQPIPSDGLREFNNGVAADRNKSEVAHLYRPPIDTILDWQPYPEAETWRKFYRRIIAYMDGIYESEDRLTLIVAHGGTIVNIIAWWLRLEEESLSYVTFYTSPASLSVLTVTPLKERSIERLNDASHMQEMDRIPRLPIDRELNTN